MPYTIDKLPDEPILLIHSTMGEDKLREMTEAIAEIARILDEQTETVFMVVDMRDVSMGLDDIVQAATLSARGRNPMLHHPNIRETIYVLTDVLIKTAVKGLGSATFGQLKAHIFDTVEEALDYCRKAGAGRSL